MITSAALLAALLAGQSLRGRHVIVSAHPDDETISAFAVRDQAEAVTIVQLTDGVPPDASRRDTHVAMRTLERAAAVSHVVIDGGVPGRDAHQHLAHLSALLRPVLADADVVWTHPYEGGHLDHDTAARLVQALAPAHLRMEFASYYMRADRRSSFGSFAQDAPAPVSVRLSGDRRVRKQAALDAYPSQAHILRKFPDPMRETYRAAPTYDFTRPAPAPLCRWDVKGYLPSTAAWRAAIAAYDGEVCV